jgi:FkbM family methyltransferase
MSIVLYGAGAAGSYCLKYLRERGEEVVAFADNNPSGHPIDGVPVITPMQAAHLYPHEQWVCAAISRPAATEIRAHIKELGVETKPLWECLPVFHGLPPSVACNMIYVHVAGDLETRNEFVGQIRFRHQPDYEAQRDPSPVSELYFPPFIKHLDEEHFADCGAADGDTVKLFCERWENWGSIVAFEPDADNFEKLLEVDNPKGKITKLRFAISDFDGFAEFTANGDYSSHLGAGMAQIRVTKLDRMLEMHVPTYIKMDIEGAELEALWGARRILKEHSPVLAICAYHTSEHLWQIPLLIHAINPDYKLFLRRYAEGAFELVWYAVPVDRMLA